MGMESMNNASRTKETIESEIKDKETAIRILLDENHLINSNAGQFAVDSIKLRNNDPEEVKIKRNKEEVLAKNKDTIEKLTNEKAILKTELYSV